MAVYLRMLANLALGGFFLASAGFKLASPALFVEQIGAFGLIWPPLLPLAAWGLIALELCAGLAVIANRRWGLWLVIELLTLFIPVLGYGVAIGLNISCGCLGRVAAGGHCAGSAATDACGRPAANLPPRFFRSRFSRTKGVVT